MQIGVITVDGRQIGVVTWAAGSTPDPTVPDLYDGGDLPQGRITQASLGDYTSDHARVGHELHHGGEGVAPGNTEHKHHHWPDHRERNFPAAGGGGGGDRVYGRFTEARDRARAELKAKPWLNEKAMHIFAGENRDPTASTALWESAINRMAVRGTSLEKELRRSGEGGYYAGYSGDVDPHTRSVLEASRDRALNYSNVSRYATDNASNQPGNHLADRGVARGRFTEQSVYHGEHFQAPLGESAKWNKTWNSMVYESEAAKHAPSAPATAGVESAGAPSHDQSGRPHYMGGVGHMEGYGDFHWGSGGVGKGSIPYGDYPITPNTVGPWGASHGAIGINHNEIQDPLRGTRSGIEIHKNASENLDRLYTEGCFSVPPGEWPSFKRHLLGEIDKGPMYLHVHPGGASITHTPKAAPSDGGDKKVAEKPFDPETMVP
jgi:hypothetical protein